MGSHIFFLWYFQGRLQAPFLLTAISQPSHSCQTEFLTLWGIAFIRLTLSHLALYLKPRLQSRVNSVILRLSIVSPSHCTVNSDMFCDLWVYLWVIKACMRLTVQELPQSLVKKQLCLSHGCCYMQAFRKKNRIRKEKLTNFFSN